MQKLLSFLVLSVSLGLSFSSKASESSIMDDATKIISGFASENTPIHEKAVRFKKEIFDRCSIESRLNFLAMLNLITRKTNNDDKVRAALVNIELEELSVHNPEEMYTLTNGIDWFFRTTNESQIKKEMLGNNEKEENLKIKFFSYVKTVIEKEVFIPSKL